MRAAPNTPKKTLPSFKNLVLGTGAAVLAATAQPLKHLVPSEKGHNHNSRTTLVSKTGTAVATPPVLAIAPYKIPLPAYYPPYSGPLALPAPSSYGGAGAPPPLTPSFLKPGYNASGDKYGLSVASVPTVPSGPINFSKVRLGNIHFGNGGPVTTGSYVSAIGNGPAPNGSFVYTIPEGSTSLDNLHVPVVGSTNLTAGKPIEKPKGGRRTRSKRRSNRARRQTRRY